MKKSLYLALAFILVFTACKKDDEKEPIKKEEPTTSENYVTCTLLNNEYNGYEPGMLETGLRYLDDFVKYTLTNKPTGSMYMVVNDSIIKKFSTDPRLDSSNYDLIYYDAKGKIIKEETYEDYILASITDYEYTEGFKTPSGEKYYLPKSRKTTETGMSIANSSTLYHYTDTRLDSISYLNADSAFITYEYKTDFIRKAKVNSPFINGVRYYEEHINEYGRVTKIDVFLYTGKQLGYILYNYDCK